MQARNKQLQREVQHWKQQAARFEGSGPRRERNVLKRNRRGRRSAGVEGISRALGLNNILSHRDEASVEISSMGQLTLDVVKRQLAQLEAADWNLQALFDEHGDLQVTDRRVVLEAVGHRGSNLLHCTPALRNDRRVVLTAVEQDGMAIRFASPALQEDQGVVLTAVQQNGMVLGLFNVWRDGLALGLAATERVRNDRVIVLAAVRQNGRALHFASPALRDDRAVVLAAVQQNREALEFASPEMRESIIVSQF